MELRLEVDDRFMAQLQELLDAESGADVAREALTLLNWAVQECLKGKVILSTDEAGGNAARLAMPSLESICGDGRTE